MIQARGRLYVGKNVIRIVCHKGLVDYYRSMIFKRWGIKTNTPAHGSHITIYNPNLHNPIKMLDVVHLNGKFIDFWYDPYIIVGGQGKGFRNFWMKVYCPAAEEIRKTYGIVNKRQYAGMDKGLHITIANTKGLHGHTQEKQKELTKAKYGN